MDNSVVLFLLRAIHILSGIVWVGGVVIVTLFILPAARATGPSGQQVLQHIMLRARLSVYLIVSAILTLLAGLALYGRNMDLTNGAWAQSPMGKGITVGAVCGLLAIILGMFVTAPAAKKLAAAGAPGGTPLSAEERARLQGRLGIFTWVVLALLAVAALTMSTARYY